MNTDTSAQGHTTAVHRTKRTRIQRAADLAFIETHTVRGRTQSEIAELLSAACPYRISRSQVSYDQDELKKRWIEASVESFSAVKAKALRELDVVLAESWDGWEKSKAGGSGSIE